MEDMQKMNFVPSDKYTSGPETENKAPVPEDAKPSVEWLTEYFQKTGRIAPENSVLTIEKTVIEDSELHAGGNIHPFTLTYKSECDAPKQIVVKTAYGGKQACIHVARESHFLVAYPNKVAFNTPEIYYAKAQFTLPESSYIMMENLTGSHIRLD